MIEVEFQCYTIFGKCDEVDWTFNYEVSEEDYKRLRKAAETGKSFRDAKEVSDLYDEIYEAAVDESTADFIENDPEMVEEYLDEDQSIEDWRSDDVFIIKVHFPDKWDD